jgi:hypothetical protein
LQFYHKKTTHSLSLSFSFFLFYIHNTNYKNSTLNKNYIKQFKIYKITPKTPGTAEKAFCTTGIVSGRLLEPQDSGGASAPKRTAEEIRNSFLPASSPAVTCTNSKIPITS